MSDWQVLLYLLGAGLMVWLIVRMVRGNPGAFTREALSRSVFTLGVLALMLIGVVFVCIKILKTTS